MKDKNATLTSPPETPAPSKAQPDVELSAIRRVLAILDSLSESQAQRVIGYVITRKLSCQVTIPDPSKTVPVTTP